MTISQLSYIFLAHKPLVIFVIQTKHSPGGFIMAVLLWHIFLARAGFCCSSANSILNKTSQRLCFCCSSTFWNPPAFSSDCVCVASVHVLNGKTSNNLCMSVRYTLCVYRQPAEGIPLWTPAAGSWTPPPPICNTEHTGASVTVGSVPRGH